MPYDAFGDSTPDRPAAIRTPEASASAAASREGFESIHHDLARFNASLELFCRKLGHVLPEISREINNTYLMASLTMDSLISEDPAGPIEIMVSALDVSLARIDKHLRDQKYSDAIIIKALESLQAARLTAQTALEDFHKRSDELYAALMAPAGPDHAGPVSAHLQALAARAHAMSGNIRDLSALQERLTENMVAVDRLHSDIVQSVEIHTALDVKSLKDTLASVVMILKDLIARSNATKGPIHTIMTALQVHDIVRQDIENILTVVDRLRHPAMDAGLGGYAAFKRQACVVSSSLLLDISAVVREHTETIAQHIRVIHEIIAGVRVDKINLAELLLINAQGSSTLDRALAEITAMFQDLVDRLDQLSMLGKRRTGMLHEMRDLRDELDRSSIAALKDVEALEAAADERDRDRIRTLRACGMNLRSAVTALAAVPLHPLPAAVHVRDAAEECIALIQEDTSAMQDSLLKLKALLVDSIEGINDYATRCMLAVLRFKRRMERLNMFLQRLPDIAAILKAVDGLSGQALEDVSEIQDAELDALLTMLYRPHIKALSRPERIEEDSAPDDGDLTLF